MGIRNLSAHRVTRNPELGTRNPKPETSTANYVY